MHLDRQVFGCLSTGKTFELTTLRIGNQDGRESFDVPLAAKLDVEDSVKLNANKLSRQTSDFPALESRFQHFVGNRAVW